MKVTLTALALLVSTSLMAAPASVEQEISIETIEVSGQSLKSFQNFTTGGAGDGEEAKPPRGIDLDKTGKVISVARDMVALGESIYHLAQKGKPSNVTEYAPISVVPRDPMTKEYADPFDMENFSMPVEKNYTTIIKNGIGKEVVRFDYKIVYSYGGSHNGVGRYLTNVMIIPSSIKTSFGWDFNASMKLGGIMNHGTKAQPVAGVMVTVKYQMNSWSASFERNDTVHITGRGELKTYNAR
jgi:hypothetical protein